MIDFATVIGFLGGFGLLGWSLWIGAGDKIGGFWDTPSAVMVFGGGIASTVLSVRLARFLSLAKVTQQAVMVKQMPPAELAQTFVKLAEIARRNGLLALQSALADVKDKFMANFLQMVVDGTDPEVVKQLMEYEAAAIDSRHTEGKQVVDLLGKYAPAYGMIGTLVGLVVMLQNMDDPKAIGPGMAVALLTTLYGAVIANMVCLPLSDKLANRHSHEMMRLMMVQTGIAGLQAGDNPRVMQAKLAVFMESRERDAFMAAAAAPAA